jgi:rSAM/selenodomain-associated transferase 1
MMSQDDTCIILFVKYPAPGQVKTRLASEVGPETAASLYRAFVTDILTTLSKAKTNFKVFFDPADAQTQFQQWLGEHLSYVPQKGRDLGEKMRNAFQHTFANGCTNALLVGSDSPDLPGDYLVEAATALNAGKIVIGPARDGGYYLIGFTKSNFLPAAFDSIAWGTHTVFEETLTVLEGRGREVHRLPEWHDVDTLADLKSLVSRNRHTDFRNSAILRYLAANRLWSTADV